MTDTDRDAFAQCYNGMLIAFRVSSDDPIRLHGELEVYFRALRDLPLDAVQAAAEGLQRAHVGADGRSFFPTAPQWHKAAEAAQVALLRKMLSPAREEPWHYEDPDCGDTGWLERVCQVGARCGCESCSKRPGDWTHPYVAPCSCRATNHTYRRRRDLGPSPYTPDEAEKATANVRRRGRGGFRHA